MDVREKLVEILKQAPFEGKVLDEWWWEEKIARIADHLIANGVTVQEWISVNDRLPDSERIVLVSALTKTFRHQHTLMAAHIGHHEFTTEDDGWREVEVDTEYDEENDCYWIPECWYEVNAVESNGNWIIDDDGDVTHWMPLPQPPKGE